jgi:hypothetical protein
MATKIKQLSSIKFSVNHKEAVITGVSSEGVLKIKYTDTLNYAEERAFKKYLKALKTL